MAKLKKLAGAGRNNAGNGLNGPTKLVVESTKVDRAKFVPNMATFFGENAGAEHLHNLTKFSKPKKGGNKTTKVLNHTTTKPAATKAARLPKNKTHVVGSSIATRGGSALRKIFR